ncbi:WD40 repeat domain-containing protein [Streptomyces sp. ME02-8801-2C]|uniref:WD40 repeat domain-containing protein n=1 Tax=Streptomyces sp. ME02-8801-2C TaxID=3028680 RepID=UPI0039F6A1DB
MLLAARDPASRLRVLVAVRADFYARCAEHRDLADALRDAALLLGPMVAAELREAVVGPAQAVGCLVERTLTARLIDEVQGEPGGLPMLSHALLETWRRRRGRTLTLAAYEAAGGVRGAIAASAERVYGDLSPEQARTARHLMLRMVEPGQGTPDTRRPLTRAELGEWAVPDATVVVERLTRARLLTADEEGVQLAHEALITCWPRLHAWIEQDRERLRHHRMLADAARSWLEHDSDPGALYRGTRLTRAEELFPDHERDQALTASERKFLTRAIEARESERRAAARAGRRHRFLTVSLSTVLAVALLTGLAVWREYDDNRTRRTRDAARHIADVADALRTTDPRAALLLGVAAWRTAELPETHRALLGALSQPEADAFTDPEPGDDSGRFLTGSGRTLLSVEGRTWRTWNVVTHRRTASGRIPAGETVVAVSEDARVLALSASDGIRLWDTATGGWTGDRARPEEIFSTVDITGVGYLVSSVDGGNQASLRSVRDGRLLFATRSAGADAAAAQGPDGPLMAVCPSASAAPQVWDTVHHRALPGDWTKATDVCGDDESSPVLGSGRLAVVTANGVRVWDLRSGHQLAELYQPDVEYTSFSDEGEFLATADSTEVTVWRLSSPDAPVFRHALNGQHLYRGLYWDPGHPTLRYLEGGTVHSLDLTRALTPAWRGHSLDDVLLSPDGRTLATAERVGKGGKGKGDSPGFRFQLRDTIDGHVVRTLPSPPLPVSRDPARPVVFGDITPLMAFDPDSGTLAYGVYIAGYEAAPQLITLWDVSRRRARTSLDLATRDSAEAVISLALDSGGRRLYAVRTPGVGELRDEVWDTGRRRRLSTLPGLGGGDRAVRPDGRLLAGDNRLARLPGGSVTGRNLVQGDEIGAFAFDTDGSLLAVGDQTGRVALWDGNAWHRVGVLRNVFPAVHGTTPEAVSALAVSPDGRILAVGGDAGSLQLWDVVAQQPLGGPLTTAGEHLDSLAFGPDGTTLYAGSTHVPLQRYVVDPERVVAQACARAGGTGLTRGQWRTYVPNAPYRRVCG